MTNNVDVFNKDPFRDYYNLESPKTWSLSCDIDWAPDFATEDLFSIVESFNLPISAFATHDSSILRNAPRWVEVGLHPDNTRPHPEFVLKHKITDLLELYPNAVGVRAHRNFFGQNIAYFAKEAGLLYDASVFHWQQKYAQGFKDQFGLYRMSYNWEDGVQADYGLEWDLKHVPIDDPGMKIFNIHPMFIYLNCPNDDYRRNIVKHYSNLQDAPYKDLTENIFQGYGARSFLIDLLKTMKTRNIQAIRIDEMVKSVIENN